MSDDETLPPSLQILEITYTNFVLARALYAFAKLGLADILAKREMSSDELAAEAELHPRALYRLLRTLTMAGAVHEAPDSRFSLGPLGEALRSDQPGSMRGWTIFSGEPYVLQAWQEIVSSIRTGDPAWDRVHGRPVFEYFAHHPEAGKIFDQAMTSLSASEAPAILGAYDFSGIAKLVEIGGGQGLLLRSILRSHPHMTGVLFDRPQVVETVREQLVREGLAERCQIAPGDFFQAVPEGGDAYLLKYVIHDWDDERSLTILGNCRRAMTSEARLLLVETVVPGPGEPHFAKLQDLEMMVVTGAMERTEEEYSRLLEQAGFRLLRVIPTMEPASILEAEPAS